MRGKPILELLEIDREHAVCFRWAIRAGTGLGSARVELKLR